MATAITRFLITLLLIFILSLVPLSCKPRTPQQKTQAEQKVAGLQSQAEQPVTRKPTSTSRTPKPRAQVKRSVFDEWKDMRARQVPEGTKVRWRLYIWSPPTRSRNEFAGSLEGDSRYEVVCTTLGHNMSDDDFRQYLTIVNGDWVEVLGPYIGVTSYGGAGCVLIGIDELTNLGPGY